MAIAKIIQTTVSTQSLEEILRCKTWKMMTQTRSGDGALTRGGQSWSPSLGGFSQIQEWKGYEKGRWFPCVCCHWGVIPTKATKPTVPGKVGMGRALPHLENNVTKSLEIHEETEGWKGWIATLGTSNGQVTGWDWNSGCLFPEPPPDTVLLTKSTLMREGLKAHREEGECSWVVWPLVSCPCSCKQRPLTDTPAHSNNETRKQPNYKSKQNSWK